MPAGGTISRDGATIPVVRAVGGLADTVTDANAATLADGSATGFVMDGDDAAALTTATRRALALRDDPHAWQQLQIAGMSRDFSWRHSARDYERLYQEIIAERAADA